MSQPQSEARTASYTKDNSKLVLDIKGGTLVPGTPVQVWSRNSPPSPNQLWTFHGDGHLLVRSGRADLQPEPWPGLSEKPWPVGLGWSWVVESG